MKKNTRVMDIIIFGTCLFGVLLLLEYRSETEPAVLWGSGILLSLIGLFFGFRAANPDIVRDKN